VGETLASIATADEAGAYQALGQLLAHVCHQNVLADAAPEVGRWLLKAAEVDDSPHAWVPLFGIVYLLTSAWSRPRYFGFAPRPAAFAGENPPDLAKAVRARMMYDDLSNRLVETLNAAPLPLCRRLADADRRTRAQSARLLAVVTKEGASVAQALFAAVDKEDEDTVRCGLLLALACHAGRNVDLREAVVRRLRLAIKGAGPLERIGGAAGLLLVHPKACLPEHFDVVRAGLCFQAKGRPDVLLQQFPWCNGRVVDVVSEALAQASFPDEPIVEILLDAIRHWGLRQDEPEYATEWMEQDLITMRLLQRAFRDHQGRRDYLQRTDLSPLQLSIVARLAHLPIEGDVFSSFGFRNLALDANRLLGIASGGLDIELEGMWETQVVRWPLWKWWHQALLADRWLGRPQPTLVRDHVLAKIGQELAPHVVWQVALDAVTGAYGVPHAPFVRLVAAVAEQLQDTLERYSRDLGPEPKGPEAALAVLPALTLAARRPVPWLGQVRPWIQRVTPADLKAEAIKLAGGL